MCSAHQALRNAGEEIIDALGIFEVEIVTRDAPSDLRYRSARRSFIGSRIRRIAAVAAAAAPTNGLLAITTTAVTVSSGVSGASIRAPSRVFVATRGRMARSFGFQAHVLCLPSRPGSVRGDGVDDLGTFEGEFGSEVLIHISEIDLQDNFYLHCITLTMERFPGHGTQLDREKAPGADCLFLWWPRFIFHRALDEDTASVGFLSMRTGADKVPRIYARHRGQHIRVLDPELIRDDNLHE